VVRTLLEDVGRADIDEETLAEARRWAREEAARWWREEHRGFSPADILWLMLRRLGVERPTDCEHVARAIARGEEALDRYPPALLPGAADLVRSLAGAGVRLAIISDTGFTTGVAQNRVLARDGLLDHFDATIYSDEVGHSKPRPEMFHGALDALGVPPAAALHVGDLEETDVKGALAVGMRAVRLDVVERRGPSAAELVADDLTALRAYLLDGE
jgi:HAD superfamily hydrolase (TIGR01549 family)